jgi:tetratricopeptide (TPR) repeat protein
MFILEQTKKVPLTQLFTNIQRRLAKDTNNFDLTYQLARLHSMAYATNLTELRATVEGERPVFAYPGSDSGVPRSVALPASVEGRQRALEHLTNAIAQYQRAIMLLKKSTNETTQRWYILPTHLGLAWCLDQAGRREEALSAYRKTLEIAWRIEVTGDFSIKEWFEERWDDMRSGRNPIHPSRTRGHLGPGVVYSEEVITYLLALLDPKRDATEIADLQKRQQTLTRMARAITPILIPLAANVVLSELVNPNARVRFDLDGTGVVREWGWITPKAAWLVFDRAGDGQINSALQMFGNVTFWIFWRDGYQALAALDHDDDGWLQGDELRGLALWQDRDADGISDPGEVLPVRDWDITAIACSAQPHPTGISWHPQGALFGNGPSRATYDWIAPATTP